MSEISRRHFLGTSAALAAAAPEPPLYAANDRIQIGVIGTGARSQEIMQALLEHKNAEIVGVADAYKGRLERALDRVGGRAKAYPTWRDIIGDKSIDAVVVATPDHWHKDMVIAAMRAGKDVYCEKPLTYRSSEGVEIQKAAKESKRILQVGSQGVSSAIQQKAKEMIRAGKLGKITMVRAAYNRNTASGAWIYPIPPDCSPDTVDWNAFLGSAPKHAFSPERFFRWRCYEDYSGGIATDLFVHLCTTIHYLMNATAPSRVLAMGQLYRWKESRDVPDTLNAILEYPEGFTVNLSSTFNNQLSADGSFQFLGTEGSIELSGGLRFVPETPVEDNRWIVESWPRKLEEAYYRDPKVIASEIPQVGKERVTPGIETYQSTGYDSTVTHTGNWLTAIRSRHGHWEDATAGHHAAACAHMVNQSVKTGLPVKWDVSKDDIA